MGGLALLTIAVIFVGGYFWLQMKSLRQWRGVFFGLALAPLVVWAIWLIKLLRDREVDPATHAMFAFEMAFIAVASFAFLLVVSGIRQIAAMARRG